MLPIYTVTTAWSAHSCSESFEITVGVIFQQASITNATSEDRTMLDSHT
jgi:hypothetical protein